MKRLLPDNWSGGLKNKIVIILIAGFYFTVLVFTMVRDISKNGITESIIQLAIIVTAFAICSYIMFFYSRNKLKKRHVITNSEKELEISKKRIIFERIIAILFLIIGLVLMILTCL